MLQKMALENPSPLKLRKVSRLLSPEYGTKYQENYEVAGQYQAFKNLEVRLKKMFGHEYIVERNKALSFNSSSKLYPLYETSFA